MRYTDLAKAMKNDHSAMAFAARTALLPYVKHSPPISPEATRAHLRGTSLSATPWLLDVPRRILKRWATRAVRALPRERQLKGPRLAMSRRHTMSPSIRAFMP